MLISLLLAGLTGFFVHRKKYGWATFTGMIFLYAMWFSIISYLSAIVFQKSMGF